MEPQNPNLSFQKHAKHAQDSAIKSVMDAMLVKERKTVLGLGILWTLQLEDL